MTPEPTPRPALTSALVITADDGMMAVAARALALLGLHAVQRWDAAELERSLARGFALVLLDPSADFPSGPVEPPCLVWPAPLRAPGAAPALAAWVADALARRREARLVLSAEEVLADPGRTSLPIPPAMRAANRLDWLCRHRPSLEEAARVVARQENLAKHVLRLAHALGGGRAFADVGRALLDLGLLRFVPLVKVVAARLLFPVRAAARRDALDAIWRFSVARAIALRLLCGRSLLGADDARFAFDAGLFADSGAAFLIWLADQADDIPVALAPPALLPPRLADQHERLGYALLARWSQRSAVVAFAGRHHASGESHPDLLPRLARLAAAIAEDALVAADPTGAAERPPDRAMPADERRYTTTLVRQELELIDGAFAA